MPSRIVAPRRQSTLPVHVNVKCFAKIYVWGNDSRYLSITMSRRPICASFESSRLTKAIIGQAS
jgi:hypothetical protein